MVDFWFNHFNVFACKGDRALDDVPAYEREAIRPARARAVPRPACVATARHPAMLFYLDNWRSTRPDLVVPGGPNAAGAGLNENYARELMELHTLGVDGGYTQQDVTEVARCFTGWTIDRPQPGRRFVFRPGHARPAARSSCSGRSIPAGGGEGRRRDGDRPPDPAPVHRPLRRHQARAPVRGRRAAPGAGRAGGRRRSATPTATSAAMLRAIFGSPEFMAADAYRAKIKKPLEFVVSAVRALGGRSTPGRAAGGASRGRQRVGRDRRGRSTRRSRPPATPTGRRRG